MRHLASIGIVAAFFMLTQPAPADEVLDGVALLPGVVEDVRIAGTWDDNEGQSGVYRVLIARSGGNVVEARFFVQWVAYFQDGTAELVHSMEIQEVAELGFDVIDYVSESDTDGLVVFLRTDNPSGDDTYELFVFAPDDYRFEAATN